MPDSTSSVFHDFILSWKTSAPGSGSQISQQGVQGAAQPPQQEMGDHLPLVL